MCVSCFVDKRHETPTCVLHRWGPDSKGTRPAENVVGDLWCVGRCKWLAEVIHMYGEFLIARRVPGLVVQVSGYTTTCKVRT